MRTISPHARALRRHMTEAEKRLWSHLRGRRMGGHKFRRQWTIGAYVADFACIELMLVIEADGGQHSENDSDARRTQWLESQGWHVLRFWNNDIVSNIDGVLAVWCSTLIQRRLIFTFAPISLCILLPPAGEEGASTLLLLPQAGEG